jgi:mRNA-degrading endonuclease RelE of RelBE toxin-antitoxin system
MQPRRLEILPSFEHAYDELPIDVQKRTQDVLALFTERTADNALRPELKNGFDNVWSIRITKGYRAFYKKLRDSEGAIYCLFHVGHHDDYRILNKLASRVSVSINAGKGGIQVSIQTSQLAKQPAPERKKKNRRR